MNRFFFHLITSDGKQFVGVVRAPSGQQAKETIASSLPLPGQSIDATVVRLDLYGVTSSTYQIQEIRS
jgi:hypothetical protein